MGEQVVTGMCRCVGLAVVLLLAAGCGAARHRQAGPEPQPARCRVGAVRPLESHDRAFAAYVRARARAYVRPGRTAIARFGSYTVNGAPTVLGVRAAVLRRDCKPAWYRVQLPVKPNGRVGYVRTRDVKLVRVRTRIAVDLSQRRLTYYRGGRVVMRVRVGIGSPATPTPVGRFYVNQSFREDPTGPYGPAAIGISAYSTVLTWWPQGGPVAIHGTDRPWTIGRAASNGCIHVPNGVARRLFRITPAGTPVRITA